MFILFCTLDNRTFYERALQFHGGKNNYDWPVLYWSWGTSLLPEKCSSFGVTLLNPSILALELLGGKFSLFPRHGHHWITDLFHGPAFRGINALRDSCAWIDCCPAFPTEELGNERSWEESLSNGWLGIRCTRNQKKGIWWDFWTLFHIPYTYIFSTGVEFSEVPCKLQALTCSSRSQGPG